MVGAVRVPLDLGLRPDGLEQSGPSAVKVSGKCVSASPHAVCDGVEEPGHEPLIEKAPVLSELVENAALDAADDRASQFCPWLGRDVADNARSSSVALPAPHQQEALHVFARLPDTLIEELGSLGRNDRQRRAASGLPDEGLRCIVGALVQLADRWLSLFGSHRGVL